LLCHSRINTEPGFRLLPPRGQNRI
jgi:hypothetical protein